MSDQPSHDPQAGQPPRLPNVGGGGEFPSYFDPDREAKAAARDRAEAEASGLPPADVTPQAARDGMIEVDEFGDPVDPNDPDLHDVYEAFGMTPPQAEPADVQDPRPGEQGGQQWSGYADAQDEARAQQGPTVSGFPFPGISGTTRGGMRYSVGGCCLPIPFGCVGLLTALGLAAGASAGILRRR